MWDGGFSVDGADEFVTSVEGGLGVVDSPTLPFVPAAFVALSFCFQVCNVHKILIASNFLCKCKLRNLDALSIILSPAKYSL